MNSRPQLRSASQANRILSQPTSLLCCSSNNRSLKMRSTLGSMRYLPLVKDRTPLEMLAIFEFQLNTQLLAHSSIQREEALIGYEPPRLDTIRASSSKLLGLDRCKAGLASKSRLGSVQPGGSAAALVSRTAIHL